MWALILGGSSGLGLATAKELARKGFNLLLVHRDGRIATKNFQEEIKQIIHKYAIEIRCLNVNANTSEGKEEIKAWLNTLEKKSIKLFVHSIADGHVKPIFSDDGNCLTEEDMLYTINSMGVSFVTWTQWLFANDFFTPNAKIFSFTSMGSRRTIPHYAAVGSAKAVLETMCRYMAYELAPHNISVNLLCAGVVPTKAIRVFPNVEQFIEEVKKKNPHHRLTRPEDVAKVLAVLSEDETSWLTGQVIPIDGGESNVY